MTTKPSDALFESIKLNAGHPKSVKALENVKEACTYLESHGISITPAEVARITSKRAGGPIDRSLRNNKKLIDYVRNRQAEQKLPPIDAKGAPTKVRTGNPDADAYIYQLEVTNRVLTQDLKSLRALVNRSGVFDPESSIEQSKLVLSALSPGKMPAVEPQHLNQNLITVLLKILNPQHYAQFGLKLDSGCLISPERNDKEYLQKDEVDAIREAIKRAKEVIDIDPA